MDQTEQTSSTYPPTKLLIASDHAGYQFKEDLKAFLQVQYPNLNLEDFGTYNNERCDYPDIAQTLCHKLLDYTKTQKPLGILICGSGIGISIAANKVKDIRCALCHNEYTAEMARRHNDANVIALGARVISLDVAKLTVQKFLECKFDGQHHSFRVDKLNNVS